MLCQMLTLSTDAKKRSFKYINQSIFNTTFGGFQTNFASFPRKVLLKCWNDLE